MADIDPFIDWSADPDVIQLRKVSDAQALAKGWSDAKVAAYDKYRRKSAYYRHFDIEISRIPANGKETEHFKRSQASTDKLKAKVAKCDEAHQGQCATPQPKQKISLKYDKRYHRMLVALRCAASNRPFASVEDEYYRIEVDYLRHGAKPPSRKTVSEDIKTIHAYARRKLHSEINRSSGKVHCTTDEWSGKLGSAWKAVTIVMLEEGKDVPTTFVLDYIRLRGKHSGKNLAAALADCLGHWGLKQRLGAVAADNATPNDVMIDELGSLVNGFLGKAIVTSGSDPRGTRNADSDGHPITESD